MYDMTEQDFETEAEREEREAVQAGNEWDMLTPAERTEREDEVAEDFERMMEYMRDEAERDMYPEDRWSPNDYYNE